ncbi:MAG: hypothetical protein ACT4P1_03735 [Sporichthyaceae bacterium]
MPVHQFVMPEYHEFIDALGAGPEHVEGEDAQSVRFQLGDEAMVITFDIPGRSLHCRWSRASEVLLETFREGAANVRFDLRPGETWLEVTFESADQGGSVHFRVAPTFGYRDKLLFR